MISKIIDKGNTNMNIKEGDNKTGINFISQKDSIQYIIVEIKFRIWTQSSKRRRDTGRTIEEDANGKESR